MYRKKTKTSLIITDLFSRKGLDIYNICMKSKISVILFDNSSLFTRILLTVIFFKKVFKQSDLLRVTSSLHRQEFVFLPIEEDTTISFIKNICSTNSNVKYLLPRISELEMVSDKIKFREFCLKNSINSPKVYRCIDSIVNDSSDSSFIIKPKFGSGGRGILFFENLENLLDSYEKENFDFDNFTVEGYIDNGCKVFGGFFLVKDGKVVDYYSHERLLVYPAFGGPSIISQSSLDSNILDEGSKILNLLNWNGLAMIEFVKDPVDGKLKVIEINPRVWGSILLSIGSGKNFISNYFRISVGERFHYCQFSEAKLVWVIRFLMLLCLGKIRLFNYQSSKRSVFINFYYGSCIRGFIFNILLFIRYL